FAGHPQAPAGLGRPGLVLLGARGRFAARLCALARSAALPTGRRAIARVAAAPLAPCGTRGAAGIRILTRRGARRAGGGWSPVDLLGVCHRQPREGVPQRRELLRDAAFEDLQQRPCGVDRVADLLEVLAAGALRCTLPRRRELAGAEVQQRDRRL